MIFLKTYIVISIQQSIIHLYFDIILVFFFFFFFFFFVLQLRLLSNYLKEESFVGRFFSFKKGINLPVSFDFTLFNCPIFFRILPARFSNDLTRGFQ